jgi:hypothetical protein
MASSGWEKYARWGEVRDDPGRCGDCGRALDDHRGAEACDLWRTWAGLDRWAAINPQTGETELIDE